MIRGRRLVWRDFSLDHIVPIARFGPHTYTNVQAAHLICNMRKGVRVD
jgi:5-methylcytosine-specific restriction endonuclease McrA